MHLTEVGMNGSDFIPETQQEEAIGAMNFEDLESFLMWNSSQKLGFHDVAELCGGAGATGTLLVRRGYSGGPNFDIVCGIDLLKPCNKMYFLKYLDECRPTILIMSTPCTGMKGFAALNKAIHRAGWLKSRRVSVPLANLASIAALAQVQAGRHFIAEHPQSSDLWMLPIWRNIGIMQQVVKVLAHQCMAGL